MEMIQLQSFYEIVRTGSFSEASRKIFRSQSAVSHQIKKLEEELKVKLFERIGKKIKLTEEGEILFDSTMKAFQNFEDLEKIFIDMKKGAGGRLVIAATGSVLTYIVLNTLKKFVKQFPKIRFKLITPRDVAGIISMVINGQVDLGISLRAYQGIPSQLSFLPWRSSDIVLIMSKKRSFISTQKLSLSDIMKNSLILPGKGTFIRNVIDEICLQKKLTTNIIMEVDMVEHIKSSVEMDIGVGIVSSFSLSHNDRRRFSIFDVSHLFGKVEFGVYCRKDKYVSVAMKEFIGLFAPELLARF